MTDTKKKLLAWQEKMLSWTDGATASSWALVVLFVLTPVAIVPAFTDMFGPIKIVLLYVIVSFATFAFAAHVYRTRAWIHRSGWMLALPLLLFVAVLISSMDSSAGFAGIIGATGQGFTAVLPLLCLLLVFAMTLSVGEDPQHIRRYTLAAMFGVLLALGLALLTYVGVSLVGSSSFPGFSPTGTFESLTILGAVMSVLSVGLWVVADETKQDTWLPTTRWKWVFGVVGGLVGVATLAGMLATDTWPTQIVLLVGSGLFVGLGLFDPKAFARPARMLAPMLLFAFALILLIVQLPWTGRVPIEANLSFGSAANIAMETVRVDGVFGSGPGTYLSDFTRFKPAGINQTRFWQVNFDHAPAHVLTLLATWGLAPLIVLLSFTGWILFKVSEALIWKREREDWQTIAVLSSLWLMLLVSQLVYASDLPIQLLFWLVTGLLLAHLMRKTRAVKMERRSRVGLLVAFGFVMSGIGFVFVLFFSGQWMVSEVLVARAVAAQTAGGSAQEVVDLVAGAQNSSRWHAGYTRALAIAHVRNINELAAGDIEQNAEAINRSAEFALKTVSRAVMLDPVDVRNVRVAADVYASLIPIVSGLDVQVVEAQRIARDLDPVNPLQYFSLTNALLITVDNAANVLPPGEEKDNLLTQLLAEAEEAINTSLQLRVSSAGLYTRALIYERQGRLAEALNEIEALVNNSPNDAVLRFEHGVLLLRSGDKQLARTAFENALIVSPTYANAKWYLAALYEEAGQVEDAIVQLQDILILNPGDATVQDKLNLVLQGQIDASASDGLAPVLVE